MDEPTNDLDMETLDLLQEVLSEFPGTVLLVSHDRDFLDRLVTATFALEGDGRVEEYPGGYEDYVSPRKQWAREAAPVKAAVAKTGAAPARPSAGRNRLTYKDQRELDLLPARIAALETEIAELETRLADPDFYRRDAEAFQATNATLTAQRAALEAAEERWLELETLRDELTAS
jgi:ATP-binding cassette subfamily F protein uup